MNLISVDSATHTATDGLLVLQITADLGDSAGSQSLPYGWRQGDPHGLGPQIDLWMANHADFPIADYSPVLTGDDVDDERDRRRALPISVTVSGPLTFQINMDALSQSNIQGLSTVGLYLSSAAPTQTTPFRDLANTTHNLLPSDLVAMGLQVAAYIGLIYQKSWAIKALTPIPADYALDSRWS